MENNVIIQMRTGRKEFYTVGEEQVNELNAQLRLDLRVEAVKFETVEGNVVFVMMQAVRLIQINGEAEDAEGEMAEPIAEEENEEDAEGYESGEE